VAVFVAHPDDETLWAGGTLLSETNWSPFVCCASAPTTRIAPPSSIECSSNFGHGAPWQISMTGPTKRRSPTNGVEQGALGTNLPSRRFDRILSHSPLGEYTRHVRHEEVARAVLRLWLRGTLSAEELWLFAYDDDGGSRLPSAIATPTSCMSCRPTCGNASTA